MAIKAFREGSSERHAAELGAVPHSCLLTCVNAVGISIPTMAIFRQNKHCSEFAVGFPNGSFITMTDSECINGKAFMT
jgi:hypothetical protein